MTAGGYPIGTVTIRIMKYRGNGLIPVKRKFIKTEGGWKRNARYVMRQHLGLKELPKNLHVHHIDGNTLNDDIENLELLSASDHVWETEHQMKDPMHYSQILKQLEDYWTMWTMYRDARDRGGKIPVGLLSFEKGGDLS